MLKTVNESLKGAEARLVKEFGQDIAGLGLNFFVYDAGLNMIQHCDGGEFVSDFESVTDFVREVLDSESEDIHVLEAEDVMLAVKLKFDDMVVAVMLIDTGFMGVKSSYNVSLETDLQNKADIRRPEYLKLMLQLFLKNLEANFKDRQQIELVSNELAQTYEELMLLYKMSNNMKVLQSDSNYLQIACDNLTELVNVEGIAVFVEKKLTHSKKLVLTAGAGLLAIDHKGDDTHDVLYERLIAELEAGADVLLDSEVYSPFKYDWPGRVKNIIAVPLYGNDKVIGMMVATNRIDKPDFDSIDAKLFNSVANECAIFIENNSLFHDMKELFIGSLKALTNSIDAKDQYTRGHSERVAFISRWIAEHYAEVHKLTPEEIQKIYIAGLLHDIGKIGISEAVLSKEGTLSDDEYEEMKHHPQIGAGILSNIKQMSDIVPGVLYHHERHDGLGYPKGLDGNQIPLAGKIVMIADTFDAMTSRRTYRKALSIETAILEIRSGLGSQFDPEVGKIFVNSDVNKMCEILQHGQSEDYYNESFNDYGTTAVGALLR